MFKVIYFQCEYIQYNVRVPFGCHCFAVTVIETEAIHYVIIACDCVLQDEVVLQFCASKLDKKDFFGKSDPFLLFSRANENGT